MSISSSRDNFEDWYPSNIVTVVRYNSLFNLESAAESIPLLFIPDKIGDKISYYGHEKVVVAIKYGDLVRGVRGPNKKPLRSFIGIDVQHDEHNFHVKLSKDNMTVMGSKLESHAEATTQVLLEIMEMTDSNLELLKNTTEERFLEILDRMCSSLRISEGGYLEEPGWTFTEDRIANFLYVHCLEHTSIEEFRKKIIKLRSLPYICRDIRSTKSAEVIEHKITSMDIENTAYSFRLIIDGKTNGVFILNKLASKLNDKGVVASFHNWQSKYVYVTLGWIDPVKKVVKTHRFNVAAKTQMRQWSPSSREVAFDVKTKFLTLVEEIYAEDPSIVYFEDV